MENIKAMGSGAKVIDKILGVRKASLFAKVCLAVFLLYRSILVSHYYCIGPAIRKTISFQIPCWKYYLRQM